MIPIAKKVKPFVEKRYNPENKYLITDEQGKPYKYGQYKKYVFDPIMQQLGMKHTPHECKHTSATRLSNAGVDEFTRKVLLAHKTDADVTDRYTHRRIRQLIDAINTI